MKIDSSYIQGIPDLLVLYKNKWAALEYKKNERAKNNHKVINGASEIKIQPPRR